MIWTYWRVEPTAANWPRRSTTSAGVPAMELALRSSTSRPMASARCLTSASSLPTTTVCAVDRFSVFGSRPIAVQAAWTRWKRVVGQLDRAEAGVELARVLRRESRRTLLARAADDDRRVRLLDRLRQRRRVGQLVVLALEGVLLPHRRVPQAGDQLELLGQQVEPAGRVREVQPVRPVLGLVPAGAEPELRAALAHLVDLRDGDREDARVAEGGRADQRAELDPAGLAGQSGQRDPGVGRSGQAVAVAHHEVVVRPEERVEAVLLGLACHREQVVVRGTLLGFGEDPEKHGDNAILRWCTASPGTTVAIRDRGCRGGGPDRCTSSRGSIGLSHQSGTRSYHRSIRKVRPAASIRANSQPPSSLSASFCQRSPSRPLSLSVANSGSSTSGGSRSKRYDGALGSSTWTWMVNPDGTIAVRARHHACSACTASDSCGRGRGRSTSDRIASSIEPGGGAIRGASAPTGPNPGIDIRATTSAADSPGTTSGDTSPFGWSAATTGTNPVGSSSPGANPFASAASSAGHDPLARSASTTGTTPVGSSSSSNSANRAATSAPAACSSSSGSASQAACSPEVASSGRGAGTRSDNHSDSGSSSQAACSGEGSGSGQGAGSGSGCGPGSGSGQGWVSGSGVG